MRLSIAETRMTQTCWNRVQIHRRVLIAQAIAHWSAARRTETVDSTIDRTAEPARLDESAVERAGHVDAILEAIFLLVGCGRDIRVLNEFATRFLLVATDASI